MIQAVDSSSLHTKVSCKALVDGAFAGALRYHYNITGDEIALLHDHGLGVSLIAEFDTSKPVWHPPIDNPETGADHARRAVDVAKRLGFPPGCVIWLTADAFVAPATFDVVGRYWELGAPIIRDAGYRAGAYGGSLFIDHLHDRGLADLTWECGADSWNSPDGQAQHAVRSRTACLRQLAGNPMVGDVQVDLNDVKSSDWGQWNPDGASHPILNLQTMAVPEEDDVAELRWHENANQLWLVSGNTKLYVPALSRDGVTGDQMKAALIKGGVKDRTSEPSAQFLAALKDISEPKVAP